MIARSCTVCWMIRPDTDRLVDRAICASCQRASGVLWRKRSIDLWSSARLTGSRTIQRLEMMLPFFHGEQERFLRDFSDMSLLVSLSMIDRAIALLQLLDIPSANLAVEREALVADLMLLRHGWADLPSRQDAAAWDRADYGLTLGEEARILRDRQGYRLLMSERL